MFSGGKVLADRDRGGQLTFAVSKTNWKTITVILSEAGFFHDR
jgi:hypothetical protein